MSAPTGNATVDRIREALEQRPAIAWLHAMQPIAWKRAGRNGRRSYTPTQEAVYRQDLQLLWRTQLPKDKLPLGGRLFVAMAFAGRQKLGGVRFPQPDADNLAKCVADAANGHLWRDDAQIEVLLVDRIAWGPDVTHPFVAVTIWELSDEQPAEEPAWAEKHRAATARRRGSA